jgi:hypothetical protein
MSYLDGDPPTSYLDRLSETWALTKQVATQGGATSVQLLAIANLRESEFNYGSDCRLKDMWQPYMDEQGDLVLMFEKLTMMGYEPIVSISIDGYGMMTTRRHDSGDVEVWCPMTNGWTDSHEVRHPMWVIAEKFLEPLKTPSIAYAVQQINNYPIIVATVAETGQEIRDVVMWDQVKHLWKTNYWDGPLAGFVRYEDELLFYSLYYEDDISRERIFTLHELSRVDAAKAHLSQFIWQIELKFNRSIRRWKKKGWLKLMARPQTDFSKNTSYGYMSTRRSEHVTG